MRALELIWPKRSSEPANALNASVAAERRMRDEGQILQKAAVDPGSLQEAVRLYRESLQWKRLAKKSKADYGRILNRLIERFGDDRVAQMTSEVVEAMRDSMATTPWTANYTLRVLSVLMSFCLTRQQFGLTDNFAMRILKFGSREGVKPRRQVWSDEEESRWLNQARITDPMLEVAYALSVFTGQRLGDVLRMTEADYDGEKIRVRPHKTERFRIELWIHVHKDLKLVLDEALAERHALGRIGWPLVPRGNGQVWPERQFADRWDAISELVGLKGQLQRRDLRRTAVTRLAEAGCGIPEICAITGHTPKSATDIIATYLVPTYPQSKAAIIKLEARLKRQSNDAKAS